jgi:hypothetical protein
VTEEASHKACPKILKGAGGAVEELKYARGIIEAHERHFEIEGVLAESLYLGAG